VVVKVSLAKLVTLEQRSEKHKEFSIVNTWESPFQAEGRDPSCIFHRKYTSRLHHRELWKKCARCLQKG
jgi:hypothetical protein